MKGHLPMFFPLQFTQESLEFGDLSGIMVYTCVKTFYSEGDPPNIQHAAHRELLLSQVRYATLFMHQRAANVYLVAH